MTFDWFTSDWHLGHKNIIEYSNRPFIDLSDMHDALITNFQDRVSPTDTVLWLGDVFFLDREQSKSFLACLPGRHFIVLGNHDKPASVMTDIGFIAAVPSLTTSINGRIARAVHNPAHADKTFGSGRKREIVLHGHTHAKERRVDNRVHVGVDAWDFCPVSVEQVRELVAEVS